MSVYKSVKKEVIIVLYVRVFGRRRSIKEDGGVCCCFRLLDLDKLLLLAD
jgi:hypothetical protein